MNEQFVSEHIMNIHENYFVTSNNASFGSRTSIGWSLILVRTYSNWYTIPNQKLELSFLFIKKHQAPLDIEQLISANFPSGHALPDNDLGVSLVQVHIASTYFAVLFA